MSLILFLCNEAIILYNLGQPEGPAIKYSGLMGRGWCTWWASCWGEAEKGIYCPLIYRIFALNCWLDSFKRNYHLGSFQEHINLVGAGPGWVLWEGGLEAWRGGVVSGCECQNPWVLRRMWCLDYVFSFREYRSRFTSEETLMFCMRVMVGVIILYDHVHPVGAFCKTSKIDVRIPM